MNGSINILCNTIHKTSVRSALGYGTMFGKSGLLGTTFTSELVDSGSQL